MLNQEEIKEIFPAQLEDVLTSLEEGAGFNASVVKAVGQFFTQMGAPADHAEMMMAMWLSCPKEIQKQILDYVAANNKDKLLPNILNHIQENQIEVNVPADVRGWVEYFFCTALVAQITKVAEKMKEL